MKQMIMLTFVSAALFGFILCAVAFGSNSANEKVIRVTAKKFEFNPDQIIVKKGEPVVLELISLDRLHGFNLPDFGIRADVKPGEVAHIRLTPNKTGKFTFFCDVFCGEGHENMNGTFIVTD